MKARKSERCQGVRLAWTRRLCRDFAFLLLIQAAVPAVFAQRVLLPPPLAFKPVDLKVLVLAGDGTEPSFASIQAILNNIGVPHDDLILAPPGKPAVPLPPLNDATKGFYQAIVLATGNLAVCSTTGTCASALPDAGWAALDSYAATYSVRTLSYYTYPNARYGLVPGSAVGTTTLAPGMISLAGTGASLFPYLNTNRPLTVVNSYVYLATTTAATGETTTPILTMNGLTVGVYHKKPDGREYVALTFDNNPNLVHSLALGYGLINWVTKGIFLGARHVYLTPQVDDIFLGNELFDTMTPGCKPSGFLVDPTIDLTSQCRTAQESGQDFQKIATWQDNIQSNPVTRGFQVTMAYNASGAMDPDTGLLNTANDVVSAVMALSRKFVWISHTFNHFNLDCYDPVPNSGFCRLATAAESATEIDSNAQAAAALGLRSDSRSMITPEISGLTNLNFVRTAAQRGIKYLIVDASVFAGNPLPSNTGMWNPTEPSILMVPRRPTSIFYNTSTAATGVPGSLPDEYNWFYGPQGLFRVGGPGGPPFFATTQTYADIINRESDAMLMGMLRFSADPFMFHQTNLIAYDGVNSLFTDVIGQTLNKYMGLMNLPVTSLPQSAIGDMYLERMEYNASGVKATWYPGNPATIKLTTARTANIPITGFCSASTSGCEVYGGQGIRKIKIQAGQTITLAQ